MSPEQNSLFHWGNYCIESGYFDMIALGRQLLEQQKPVECIIYNK